MIINLRHSLTLFFMAVFLIGLSVVGSPASGADDKTCPDDTPKLERSCPDEEDEADTWVPGDPIIIDPGTTPTDPPVEEPTDPPEEPENPDDPTPPTDPQDPGDPKPEKPRPDKPRPDKPRPDKPTKPSPGKPGGSGENRPHPPSGGISPPVPEKTESAQEEASAPASVSSFAPPSPSGFLTTPEAISRASIRSFDIPPFLLPIYQACGQRYGVPWPVLASINRIETDFGRLNGVTSSAGAQGWMQFMPATWLDYGTDANRDRIRDPYNPVDAICAAARYLKAAGAPEQMEEAIWAYNHADWYVADVLRGARGYSALPVDLVAGVSSLASAGIPVEGSEAQIIGRRGLVLEMRSKPGVAVKLNNSARVISRGPRSVLVEDSFGNRFSFRGIQKGHRVTARPLAARTTLARTGKVPVQMTVRPSGARSPLVSPRAFLSGWRVLDRAGFAQMKKARPARSLQGLLAEPQRVLEKMVLSDPNLDIYECGRSDIAAGIIDRRVLVLLLHLADRGYSLGITSLQCGHSYLSASGYVSNHSSGRGVDIASINGEIISPSTQYPGSLTETVVKEIMGFPGEMYPDELISLFDFGGPSWGQADHGDHIHVAWDGSDEGSSRSAAIAPGQWRELIKQLNGIPVHKPAEKTNGRNKRR